MKFCKFFTITPAWDFINKICQKETLAIPKAAHHESGTTAIEYGFFGMILMVVLISFLRTGSAVDGAFQKLTAVTRALNGSAPAGQTQAQGQLRTPSGLVDKTH